jgi:hypothetical protein
MDFERFLRRFLESMSAAFWVGTVALAVYSLGYGLFIGAPPLRLEIGFLACLMIWLVATGSLRLIFPEAPKGK